jgi:hypothetical protein
MPWFGTARLVRQLRALAGRGALVAFGGRGCRLGCAAPPLSGHLWGPAACVHTQLTAAPAHTMLPCIAPEGSSY